MTNKIAVAIASDEAERWATNIQHTLLRHQPMIDLLNSEYAPTWWEALRQISRRWECAKYNEDGSKWVVIDADSADHQSCKQLTELFPGLLEEVSVFEDVARILAMEPQA